MKIGIIVLSYNSADYISKCLSSISKLHVGNNNIEVIIVDNQSSDTSVSLLKTKYPKYTLIQNEQNLGYAEGNNVGIRYALSKECNFIWIVNPDVELDSDSLTEFLISADKYKNAGIFGSKIYFSPGFEFHKERYTKSQIGKVIWYAGGNMDWGNLIATHRGVDQVDEGQFDLDIETDFVTGASMFIRSKVFNSIGLLDKRYFLYYEENDFCQKAKNAGWKLMYIPNSIAWHANAQSTGIGSSLQDYYISRNRMLFGLNHAPLYTKLHLIKQSLQLYFTGRPWQKRAIIDYYLHNFGPGSYQP